MTKMKSDEYLMGVDYGSANIGIALGKSGAVSPIRAIPAKNLQQALNEIVRFAFENKVAAFVLGIPLTADGKETKKSLEIRRFAKLLKAATKKQIFFQNEYATTLDAEEEMLEFEVSQKKRRIKDHYAAALILKQYYTSLA